MDNSSPAVVLEGLRVRRGRREVLPELNLRLPAGAVVGVLGPSGCGKTTLLRAIVGAQLIAGGRVRVFGLPAGDPRLRAMIGYATQTPAIYADLRVRENLRYFAAVLRAPACDVDRVLDLTDLRASANQLVGELSGGQRARVNLAVALLGSPRLLVLDEPTVGLDPVLRARLWRLFRALAADGMSLVVSSHVMDEAARCDRLVLIREGRVIADDTPGALLDRTGTTDVEQAFLSLVRAGTRTEATA